MKRKVIKQGHNTLTVTLPAKWVDKAGIKAGDELELEEKEGSLVIGNTKIAKGQKITVDVTGLDRSTILILIQGLYRYGYDTMEITAKESLVNHHRVGKKIGLSGLIYSVVNRLVGTEVISASSKRYVIKRIAGESIDDFPTILRRIFLLLNEMMESFINGMRENDSEAIKSIEFQHSNLKKFLNYCLRLLNKYGYGSTKKTMFYFNIISLLSKLEDLIKNNARYVLKHQIKIKSKNSFILLKEMQSSIRQYYELFYSYNLNKVAELSKHRDMFRSDLFKLSKDISKDENLIIGGLSSVVELILDMTETKIALED